MIPLFLIFIQYGVLNCEILKLSLHDLRAGHLVNQGNLVFITFSQHLYIVMEIIFLHIFGLLDARRFLIKYFIYFEINFNKKRRDYRKLILIIQSFIRLPWIIPPLDYFQIIRHLPLAYAMNNPTFILVM